MNFSLFVLSNGSRYLGYGAGRAVASDTVMVALFLLYLFPGPLTGVINHISYGIEPWDTEKVKAELEGRGLRPRPDMVGDNFKSFHVYDPDGWDLQISNQTRATRGSGSGD